MLNFLHPYPMDTKEHWTDSFIYIWISYIECRYYLSWCCMSVTVENSCQNPLFIIIKNLCLVTALSMVSDNTFHQLFLVNMWHHSLKDIKYGQNLKNDKSYLFDTFMSVHSCHLPMTSLAGVHIDTLISEPNRFGYFHVKIQWYHLPLPLHDFFYGNEPNTEKRWDFYKFDHNCYKFSITKMR